MRNWKQIAGGFGADIPEPDLERIVGPLDQLEAAFRPLVKTIPLEVEPATTFHPEMELEP